MAAHKGIRAGLVAFLVTMLVSSSALMNGPSASAEELEAPEQVSQAEAVAPAEAASAALEVVVAEVPEEKIVVDVTGSGFGGTIPPERAEAGVSIGIVEAGIDLSSVDADGIARISAAVAADGTLTGFSGVLEQSADLLDATKAYEIVSWPADTPLLDANVIARAEAAVDWEALSPSADPSAAAPTAAAELSSAEETTAPEGTAAENNTEPMKARALTATREIDVTVTEITNSKIVMEATGRGFNDVPPLGTPPRSHIYLGLIEKGADLTKISQDSTIPSVAVYIKEDGTFDASDFWAPFEESAGNLDPEKNYEVIAWPARSNPTPDTLYSRTDITIDWVALFTGATLESTVTRADQQSGLEVTIEGRHISAADTVDGVTVAFVEEGREIKTFSDAAHYKFVPAVTGGVLDHTLVVPPSSLDRSKQYEIVLFGGPDFAKAEERRIATGGVNIRNSDWEKIFPASSDEKRLIVDVVSVPNEKVVVEVEGAGFQDVRPLPGQTTPHAYLALVPKGTDLSTVSESTTFANVSADILPDGTFGSFSAPFEQDIAFLDRTKSYEVISWPSRSNPTEATLYARADAKIDWNALFPAGAVSGTATVASATETGLIVRTALKNLDPSKFRSGLQMGVVLRGTADGAMSFLGNRANVATIPDSGSVSADVTVPRSQLDRHAQYEVVVWPANADTPRSSNIVRTIPFNVSQAQWESIFPAPPAATSAPAAGALIWGVSEGFRGYTVGRIAKGDMRTNGVGGGPGGYLFPQATSESWNRATNTGSVQYSGSVTFWGHGGLMNESFSNPVLTISGPASGSISVAGRGTYPLALSAGSMSTNPDGSVTWRNVPINGEICGGGSGGGASGGGCFGLDPVTFTIGSVSAVSYGATVAGNSTKPKRTPAATPPATTGITVLTDADKLKPGGRIEIEASGFDPNDEGVLVVLYSDPIVLDEEAKADRNGVVSWSGTLPEDISLGEHTITLQGSKNAGAVIKIVEDDKDKKAASGSKKKATQAIASDRVAAAGVLGGTQGMALWEWWAAAGGLIVIAACTTTLAVRQRRSL